MKYFGYFTDNYDCAMRQPASEDETAIKIAFNSLEDLYMFGLALYDDEEDISEYENMSREELEEANASADLGFGSPFLYYAEDENGNVCFDAGLTNEEDFDVPAMHLDGYEKDEEDFHGNLNIDGIPIKVIKAFCPYNLEDLDDEDDDWDEDYDEDDEDEE